MKIQDLQQTLESLHKKFQNLNEGSLASYIPELAKVNPNLFAISVTTRHGETFSVGDTESLFTLQSASKPFMYGLSLDELGSEVVHHKVGVEPSGEAFNSIIELEKKTHRPFNPMVNAGAIAIANLIYSNTKKNKSAYDRMLQLFSELANENLAINTSVFNSEKKTAHRNRAIAHLLRHFDVIDDAIDESLDLYFNQCSVQSKINHLSQMAATLANEGTQPLSNKIIFSKETNQKVLSLMFSCGMYDTAGTWSYSVGIPAKSGVSGAMIAVVPRQLGIAVYSPLINSHGHSIRGVKVIEEFIQKFNMTLF